MSEPKKVDLIYKVEDFLEKKVPAKYYLGEKGFAFVTSPIKHIWKAINL